MTKNFLASFMNRPIKKLSHSRSHQNNDKYYQICGIRKKNVKKNWTNLNFVDHSLNPRLTSRPDRKCLGFFYLKIRTGQCPVPTEISIIYYFILTLYSYNPRYSYFLFLIFHFIFFHQLLKFLFF